MKTFTDSGEFTSSEFSPHPPLQDWRQLKGHCEPQFILWKKLTVNSPPDILKSNTITRFKIISSLRNNLQIHRQLPEFRNKHFEVGYWKDFTINKCFHRNQPKLIFLFSLARQIFFKLSVHIQKVLLRILRPSN